MTTSAVHILVSCFLVSGVWTDAATVTAQVAQQPVVQKTDAGAAATRPRAQLFKGIAPHRRPVTTDSAEAQRYFDQGLTWAYAFNHDEAIRSFKRAAKLDETAPWHGGVSPTARGPSSTSVLLRRRLFRVTNP